MPNYCVNKKAQNTATGEHEVHNVDICSHLPNLDNQISLGNHINCQSAVLNAKNRYPKNIIDGCYHCCNDCHTR